MQQARIRVGNIPNLINCLKIIGLFDDFIFKIKITIHLIVQSFILMLRRVF